MSHIFWDDQDSRWLNSAKDHFCKKFVRNSSNMYHLCAFKNLQQHLNWSIQVPKQNYVNKISQKQGDLNTSSKCYWSLFKILLNGKKIPCVPPVFHDNEYAVDFRKKWDFQFFFHWSMFFDFKQKRLTFLILITYR